jgi:hypothetical protein
MISQKFPSLEEIVIWGGKGIERLHLSQKGLSGIRRLPHLRTFELTWENVSCATLARFSECPELRSLTAELPSDVEGQTLRIHDFPRLEYMKVTLSNDNTTSPWTLCLERMPNIKEVVVEDAGKLRIDGACNLEKLSLGRCVVPVADLSQLLKCPKLTDVELFDVDGDLDGALQQLIKIPSLRRLGLSGTTLTENGLRQLGLFKQLRELDLSGNDEVDDRCLRPLERLKGLRVLKINDTKVTAEGVKRIEGAIPGLKCVVKDPWEAYLTPAAMEVWPPRTKLIDSGAPYPTLASGCEAGQTPSMAEPQRKRRKRYNVPGNALHEKWRR